MLSSFLFNEINELAKKFVSSETKKPFENKGLAGGGPRALFYGALVARFANDSHSHLRGFYPSSEKWASHSSGVMPAMRNSLSSAEMLGIAF